jgi:hypothetical protein
MRNSYLPPKQQPYEDERTVHTILFQDKEQAMLHCHLLSAYKLVQHKVAADVI